MQNDIILPAESNSNTPYQKGYDFGRTLATEGKNLEMLAQSAYEARGLVYKSSTNTITEEDGLFIKGAVEGHQDSQEPAKYYDLEDIKARYILTLAITVLFFIALVVF
jgi:hypothetical protein